jgi:hypothetical protein
MAALKGKGTDMTKSKPVDMARNLHEVTLARKDKPDVRWTGRLIAEVDSDRERRDGGHRNSARWTRLQLWELKDGAWLAATIGCSDREGEVDIGDVLRIPLTTVNGVAPWHEAMEFWQWSWLAKKLAERMGWDVVEVIGE